MGIDENLFISPISEHFRCCICTNIAYPPVKTHCDHVFCKECITEWVTDHNSCPLDRQKLETNTLKEDKFLARLLNEYKVKCEKHSDGCKWTGSLEQSSKHVEKECDYKIVSCTNENCTHSCIRLEMEEHKKKCEWRLEQCTFCYDVVIARELKVL